MSASSGDGGGELGKRSLETLEGDDASEQKARRLSSETLPPMPPRPKDWFGAAASSTSSTAKNTDTAAVVSSLKAKLSKPKDTGSLHKPKLLAAKAGLTEAERLKEQQRHREKAEATGKAVPYYRKA